ncbi:hypothetical protein P7K49_028386 [Saguinus oedipus]|uniref:Fibronectin type-III domain-containing protein n=1 Tax=Saguinus oedipus TaxID=9490 RepID=A0ABQ9UC29_SAGOE|nr:hypothetical protein P7K49_028386 [Saguinus oedipus]
MPVGPVMIPFQGSGEASVSPEGVSGKKNGLGIDSILSSIFRIVRKEEKFPTTNNPMRGPRKLEVVEVKSRQITIRWEPFGYNVTRCHSYNLTVHYCYQVGGQEQVREEVSWDTENSHPQHTITNLSPYTNVSVKLILMNPEGRKESQELIVQTDEDRE